MMSDSLLVLARDALFRLSDRNLPSHENQRDVEIVRKLLGAYEDMLPMIYGLEKLAQSVTTANQRHEYEARMLEGKRLSTKL